MVAGEAATTTMGALTMPDASDQIPNELSEQLNAVVGAVSGLVLASYGKGLRDGMHSSSQLVDGMAAVLRNGPIADQLSGVIGMLDALRDQLRLSAHEVTTPGKPVEPS